MHVRAEEHQRFPESHQKLGERCGTPSSPGPQREQTLPTHGFWNSSLQNHKAIHFCCLSHSICGTFVTAPTLFGAQEGILHISSFVSGLVGIETKMCDCKADDVGCFQVQEESTLRIHLSEPSSQHERQYPFLSVNVQDVLQEALRN